MEYKKRLNVVSNDFPKEADLILGTEFLKEQDAVLSFKEETLLYGNPHGTTPFVSHDTVSLPARTKSLTRVTIQNSTRSNGYLPKINAGPGIYMG